jgi:hypothetical protein
MSAAAAREWQAAAAALRDQQRMTEADAAIARAAVLAPDDRLIAFLLAQSRYELGLPAAKLFARAATLWPDNPDVVRNRALALAAEGDLGAAEAVLETALATAPGWLDGQRVLASLRWTGGDDQSFDRGFAAACVAPGASAGLWLGWFSTLAQLRLWPRAVAVLDRAEAALGPLRALAVARAFAAAESGDGDRADQLLAALDGPDDAFLALCRIRQHLRRADPAAAGALALPLAHGPAAGQIWPYLSTCWRLLGDARAAWLDGEPLLAGVVDCGLSLAECADLAELLRGLHTARAAYAEQSVRLGTQTDRSVLLRHEPALARARAALEEAMRGFVATLPPAPPSPPGCPPHPLLSRPRGGLRIAGSWSVRLGPGGHNVTHSHPAGWLSSACYIALPDAAERGDGQAGWLQLGAPPPELGLDLPPLRLIEPSIGKMAIFPSTLWHGTVPFTAGERLNIAFDVVPAAG